MAIVEFPVNDGTTKEPLILKDGAGILSALKVEVQHILLDQKQSDALGPVQKYFSVLESSERISIDIKVLE